MSYSVECLNRERWLDQFHERSFQNVFGASKDKELERSNFALVVYKDSIPFGFVTCIEMDGKTLYWQLGGSTDSFKKSFDVMNGYVLFLDWCSQFYDSVSTRIQNTNLPMLKMALKCGFLIVGTRCVENKIYLELIREFEHGQCSNA